MNIPIDPENLTPEARSWLICRSSEEDVSPSRVAESVLMRAAERDGFVAKSKPTTVDPASHEVAA